AAQAADVDLDQIGRVRKVEAPDAFDEGITADHPAGVAQEQLKDAELAWRQLDRAIEPADDLGRWVERQACQPQDAFLAGCLTPQQRPQPGEQLAKGE